jgi:hypothetical protein
MNSAARPSVGILKPEKTLILERIALGTAAISWWLFCEYLRTRTTKPGPSKFLTFAGFSGGFALIFYAAIM